jgi:hypothetical protein
MTDCNRESLAFSSLGSKSVVADFLGGRLTFDAGAILLRGTEQQNSAILEQMPSASYERLDSGVYLKSIA